LLGLLRMSVSDQKRNIIESYVFWTTKFPFPWAPELASHRQLLVANSNISQW
jgi:hypothetical protein